MKKKVDWSDGKNIAKVVSKSVSYADALKQLGLKPVNANTKTLKKYIDKYDIDTSHFGGEAQTEIKRTNKNLANDEEPRVEVIGIVHNPRKGIEIELDWNDAFIDFLKQNGYTGTNDEAVVQLYLTHLYQNMAEEMANDSSSQFER